MAKGKKTGGRDFQPGQVTNPNGRPKVPDDIRETRKLDQFELERMMNRFLDLTADELTSEIKSGKLKGKELIIATIISKAIVFGDQKRFEFILNRLIGKVTENIKHTYPNVTILERIEGGVIVMGSKESG
jgi:hypothetical protein